MANWSEILGEITQNGGTQDIVRRKYLKKLSDVTGRNTIAYYSGWLQKPFAPFPSISINDNDKNGLMNAVYKIDCSKGLDLILHTPGGETTATESIVDYLRSKFGTDIRVIVPQLSMSAGTMVACASKEILMGKQSSLGPIDPQLGGFAAYGVLEEFKEAIQEVTGNPQKAPIWQVIISKYSPTLLGECQKSIDLSKKMVTDWLTSGMFLNDPDVTTKVNSIVEELTDHTRTLSHSRHLSSKTCSDIGLKITKIETNQKLQDAILSVHHAFMLTLDQTPAVKIIENQQGKAYIQTYLGQ